MKADPVRSDWKALHEWNELSAAKLTLPTLLVRPLITSPVMPRASIFIAASRMMPVPAWCGTTKRMSAGEVRVSARAWAIAAAMARGAASATPMPFKEKTSRRGAYSLPPPFCGTRTFSRR